MAETLVIQNGQGKGYFQTEKLNYRMFLKPNVILHYYLYLNIKKTVSLQYSLHKMHIQKIKLTLKMKNPPCYLLFSNTRETFAFFL